MRNTCIRLTKGYARRGLPIGKHQHGQNLPDFSLVCEINDQKGDNINSGVTRTALCLSPESTSKYRKYHDHPKLVSLAIGKLGSFGEKGMLQLGNFGRELAILPKVGHRGSTH